jgi:hypothetical protein
MKLFLSFYNVLHSYDQVHSQVNIHDKIFEIKSTAGIIKTASMNGPTTEDITFANTR